MHVVVHPSVYNRYQDTSNGKLVVRK